MLDIKFLRENPEIVKENIRKKYQDYRLPLVDEVIKLDAENRAIKQEVDIYELAAPAPHKKVRLTNQLELLWRREFAALQAKNGLHKYAGKSRAFVKKYLLTSIPPESLKQQILETLLDRDYTVFEE